MAGLSGRRFSDPILLFPLCRSYHPYPLYLPDRIQHQMCCRNGRHQGKMGGTFRRLHRDDSADLFQFPLRLPSEQHPCRGRWSQRVPCQHLAAHLYPNVYKEDRKKEGTSRVSSSMVQELPTGYPSSASSSPYSSAIGSSDTVYGYMAP